MVVVVPGRDHHLVGILPPPFPHHFAQVPGGKRHDDGQSGAAVQALARGYAFAKQDRSVRGNLSQDEPPAAHTAAEQPPLAAVRPDPLEGLQRAFGIAHRHQQGAIPSEPQALGVDPLTGDVGVIGRRRPIRVGIP